MRFLKRGKNAVKEEGKRKKRDPPTKKGRDSMGSYPESNYSIRLTVGGEGGASTRFFDAILIGQFTSIVPYSF